MLELALNLFFPKVCGICGKLDDNWLCEECLKNLNLVKKNQIIDVYGKNYSKFLYLFLYKDIRKEILRYKFSDESYLSNMFTNIILDNKKIIDYIKNYDVIIPVPMHKSKKAERGYNQTELIAKKLSKSLNIKYDSKSLIKIKNNKTQSSLKEKQRIKNIQGVFEIKNNEEILGKNIILFDDIVTTGSTIEECSRVLKKAGTKQIIVLALAKD